MLARRELIVAARDLVVNLHTRLFDLNRDFIGGMNLKLPRVGLHVDDDCGEDHCRQQKRRRDRSTDSSPRR